MDLTEVGNCWSRSVHAIFTSDVSPACHFNTYYHCYLTVTYHYSV